MGLRVALAADHRRMPWVNGRGTTTELARRETSDGRLLFRLSVADVVEDGPFSPLPNVDRKLVLIEGAGFDLSIDGRTVPVHPFAPIAFAGEEPVAAVGVRGPSRDFNLMTGRGLATGVLSVHRSAVRCETSDAAFAYVVSGTFACGGLQLGAGDLLAVETHGGPAADISGEGVLILAGITLADDGLEV